MYDLYFKITRPATFLLNISQTFSFREPLIFLWTPIFPTDTFVPSGLHEPLQGPVSTTRSKIPALENTRRLPNFSLERIVRVAKFITAFRRNLFWCLLSDNCLLVQEQNVQYFSARHKLHICCWIVRGSLCDHLFVFFQFSIIPFPVQLCTNA